MFDKDLRIQIAKVPETDFFCIIIKNDRTGEYLTQKEYENFVQGLGAEEV